MADFSVPIATGVFPSPPDIANARGTDLSWIGNLPNAYWAGQNQEFLQRNRNLFQNGIPPDMATALLKAGGAASIPEYVALKKLEYGQQDTAPIPGEYGSGASTPVAANSPPSSAPAVPSSPTVVGDAEGVRTGLYDAPAAPGLRPPIQQEASAGQPVAFGQRFGTMQPPSAPPSGAVAGARPVQTVPVQSQAQSPDDQKIQAEIDRQQQIADVASQRARRQAAIGNDAESKAFLARAAEASQNASEMRKSLLQRAPGVAAFEAQKGRIEADNKGFQADYSGVTQLARSAQAQGLSRIDDLKSLTLQPNFYSGPFAKGMQTYNQFKAIFGNDPTSAVPAEAFNKGVSDLVLEQIRGLAKSGVGRVLQAEVQGINRATATLENTPAGNRAQLETLKRTYQQQAAFGQIADQVAEAVASGRVAPGLYQATLSRAIDDYTRNNQPFTAKEKANPVLLGAVDAPTGYDRMSLQQRQSWAAQSGVRAGDPLRSGSTYVKAQ
jgi:hypothetical protein